VIGLAAALAEVAAAGRVRAAGLALVGGYREASLPDQLGRVAFLDHRPQIRHRGGPDVAVGLALAEDVDGVLDLLRRRSRYGVAEHDRQAILSLFIGVHSVQCDAGRESTRP
jgi:hypothetical protein